jgi:hypothetical protein
VPVRPASPPVLTGFDAALAALLLDFKRVYVELRAELRRIYAPAGAGSVPDCRMALGYVPVPGTTGTVYNDLGPGSIDGWLAGLGARELLDAAEPLRRRAPARARRRGRRAHPPRGRHARPPARARGSRGEP